MPCTPYPSLGPAAAPAPPPLLNEVVLVGGGGRVVVAMVLPPWSTTILLSLLLATLPGEPEDCRDSLVADGRELPLKYLDIL